MGIEISSSSESVANFSDDTALIAPHLRPFSGAKISFWNVSRCANLAHNSLSAKLLCRHPKPILIEGLPVSRKAPIQSVLGKRHARLTHFVRRQRQMAGPDFGLTDRRLSHGGFDGNLLKLLQKEARERAHPRLGSVPDILWPPGQALLSGANNRSFSLPGANQAGCH
jgi:hypothetical protein